jgi:hypothetical protein
MNPTVAQIIPKLLGLALLAIGAFLLLVGPRVTRLSDNQTNETPGLAGALVALVAPTKTRQLYLQWLGVILPVLGILAIILGVMQLFQRPGNSIGSQAIVTQRLTPSSTRTPPALSVALSQLLASSAPLIALAQAWPVSLIR